MRTKLFLIVGIISLSLMGCSGGGGATDGASPAAQPTAAASAPATP